MKERWTPAYDRLFDPTHELRGEPVCRAFAWLDLCHMARWESGNRIINGTVVPLKRAELVASLRYLAHRWGWSVKRVRTFLAILGDQEVGKLGTVRDTPQGTVYCIAGYDTYANPGHTQGHTNDHDRGTGGAQAGHKEQQGTSRTSGTDRGDKKPTQNRATRLPDSWEPTEAHEERASETGLNLAREAEGFRLHATEKGRTAKCWNSAFTRWLMNAEEFKGRGNGKRSAGRSYSDPTLEIDWEAEAKRINKEES